MIIILIFNKKKISNIVYVVSNLDGFNQFSLNKFLRVSFGLIIYKL